MPILSVKSEIMNKTLSVAPAFLDLDPTSQVDVTLEKLFHVLSRSCGNALEHCSVLADYYSLMAVLFAINNRLDIHDVGVLTFTHFFNADRNAVRNLSVKISQKAFHG